MTTDGNSLNDRQLALVHDTLEAVKLSEGIVHRPECNKAIGFAEIYAYATQPQHEPSAELLSALDGECACVGISRRYCETFPYTGCPKLRRRVAVKYRRGR